MALLRLLGPQALPTAAAQPESAGTGQAPLERSALFDAI
jgi:hypothetical protein